LKKETPAVKTSPGKARKKDSDKDKDKEKKD
jgi:hypothetical protein